MNRTHIISKIVWLICACALWRTDGQAQSQQLPDFPRYAVEHFGERFGLNAATITTMAQDSRGFLWIGTQTGLFRYDGAGVKRFDRNDGLPGELIDLIVPAPDESIWVRTRNGIAHFTQEQFVQAALPPEAGELRQVFQSFAVDSKGTLFVATIKGLLRLSQDGQYAIYGPSHGVPEQVDAIVRSGDDTIWLAGSGLVFKFGHASLKPELVGRLGTHDEPVVALLPSPDSSLWIRTAQRVGKLGIQHFSVLWMESKIPEANGLGGPSLDRKGDLLLPTYKGLYRWLGDQWQVIDRHNGLTSSALFSALEDREGGIWVGTAGAGLDHWPGSGQWSGWTDSEGLPDPLVLGVARDGHARLWVGTNSGLTVWNPSTRQWHTWNENGLAGAGASQLVRTKDGAIWALFQNKGMYRFDATSPHPRAQRVSNLSGNSRPVRIAAATDGSIWAAGKSSLQVIRYREGSFEVQRVKVPLEEINTIQNVSVSPGGVIWTGGPHGLARFFNGTWQRFQKEDGLLATDVLNVRAIKDDEVWVGYPDEGAVTRARFSDGRLVTTNFPRAKCALSGDAKQHVWLEMDEGLGVVSPDDAVRRFTQRDGLIWNDVNCDAFWNESDGGIFIGTSKGLAHYDPEKEPSPISQPKVVLTSAFFGKSDHLQEREPEIAYQDSTFVARFAAPIFYDPDGVNCRFRLRGLEQELTETAAREVRYSSLPAGTYTFEVSCGSSQLGWSVPATYSFSIAAPWWQSWWAELLAAVLLTFVLWAFVGYRTRRDRRERERLERKVAERSAELARANRELHEVSLRDPLTGVRNRRFFQTTIAADASQATRAYLSSPEYSRDHRDLIFYLIDIDNFKEINDNYGHDAGDNLLIEIANRLESIVRESDFLIRWGGEEFLLVCRAAERENGDHTAERILSAIGTTPFHLGGGRLVFRTCSVGWAPFPWSSPAQATFTVEEVLRFADHGLLLAKQRGKDQAIGILPPANLESIVVTCTCLEQLLEQADVVEICTKRSPKVSSKAGNRPPSQAYSPRKTSAGSTVAARREGK